MNSPLLWFANPGTGFVLLVLLTLTVLLGVLATRGDAGRRVPRFLTQGVHRNLSLLATLLLGVHVFTAVADEYVDIRWWQAVWPVGASYQPLWLGLGSLALDLAVVVVLTSLLRHRLSHGAWRLLHLLTYPIWVLALAHGLGIGTDARTGPGLWTCVACAGVVALAIAGRLAGLGVQRARRTRDLPRVPAETLPVRAL
jgi:sulfoxide reductase heme-binding subunit YedZ